MFTRILVPLDRSAFAEQALGVAAAIARAATADVDVALVHEPFPVDAVDDSLSAGQWADERAHVASIAVELFTGAGVQVTHAVLNGDPVEMICRHARYAEVDLIVMASHGRTGMKRAWFGSVADGVVRKSSIPVLLIRGEPGTSAHHGVPKPLYDHIFVPLDGSAMAAEVLGPASALAVCMGARLTLFRAIELTPISVPDAAAPFAIMPIYLDDEVTQRSVARAAKELQATADRLRAGGLDVTVEVVTTVNVAQAIADAAGASQAQLIAMTTHGRGASRLIVGSIADKVLETSGLPLLVFRPAAVHVEPEIASTEPPRAEPATDAPEAALEVAADVGTRRPGHPGGMFWFI